MIPYWRLYPLPSPKPLKEGVVLLSGGLDSTITLAYLLHKGVTVHPLAIGNSSKYFEKKAMRFIRLISEHYKIHTYILESVNPEELLVKTSEQGADLDYVPGYQTFIYFPALAYADKLGVDTLYTGFNSNTCIANEGKLHPNRKINDDTISAINSIVKLYNKLYDSDMEVVHIFGCATKAEQLEVGKELRVPFEKTNSCWNFEPNSEDVWHCGSCFCCVKRKEAFRQAELVDPVKYLR
jgi:7-cyano-7-deazaguanine synthase